jgi:hypothetical protein
MPNSLRKHSFLIESVEEGRGSAGIDSLTPNRLKLVPAAGGAEGI